jgi:acyl carrier protein
MCYNKIANFYERRYPLMEIKKTVKAIEKKTGIDLPDEKIEKLATKENLEKAKDMISKVATKENVEKVKDKVGDIVDKIKK